MYLSIVSLCCILCVSVSVFVSVSLPPFLSSLSQPNLLLSYQVSLVSVATHQVNVLCTCLSPQSLSLFVFWVPLTGHIWCPAVFGRFFDLVPVFAFSVWPVCPILPLFISPSLCPQCLVPCPFGPSVVCPLCPCPLSSVSFTHTPVKAGVHLVCGHWASPSAMSPSPH